MSRDRIFGLLGGRLSHSWSPEIHACLGGYEYRLFERGEDEIAGFLRSDEFEAINVTIPYKKAVMPYLCEISPEARRIGSVNTITRTADGLQGDNTDYFGFSYMLDSAGIEVHGKKCLVLGSGGASVTACTVIGDRGGEAVVISRSGENNYNNLGRHIDADVIVNTTPVGMYPDCGSAPLSLAGFRRLSGVVDMIYNPRRTALLFEAERLGIPAAGGLTMLVAQAVKANSLFFDRADEPDKAIIADVTERMRLMKSNIILIGMPGSGKSTAGRALAERLGRQFHDTDEEVTRLTGRTPADIIKTDGEAAFRAAEHEAVRGVGKLSGCVIATGGGVVTYEKNRDPLRQNGIIVFLERPPGKLSISGRPLSAAAGIDELYRRRLPLYLSWADCTALCEDDVDITMRNILDASGMTGLLN